MNHYKRFEGHCHSHYSNIRLIDSINTPKSLIDRALELGLAGIALTDHEALCGSYEFWKYGNEVKKNNPNFKIGLGNEIYLVDERISNQKYYHFILIAKDDIGFKQLRKLSTKAWLQSYKDRGQERVPTLKSELKEIIEKNRGHIIASSACIGGELGQNILLGTKAAQIGNKIEAQKASQKIHDFVSFCKDLFEDDFYFEVQPASNKEQILVNQKIKQLSDFYKVKITLTTDAHYGSAKQASIHESFLNSKDGEREVKSFYEFAYLQTEEEIIQNLKPSLPNDYEELCKNTLEIMNKIEEYHLEKPQQIPKLYSLKDYPKQDKCKEYPHLNELYNSDDISERNWVNQCCNELKKKGLYKKEYLEELDKEADIKKTVSKRNKTNIFNYPLVLQHYIDLIWDCGSPIGAGRGSAGAGLNHWLLGITQVDPIRFNMNLFERYMNWDTEGLPDIDIDISPIKRPKILKAIKKERGQYFNEDIDDISKEHLGCSMVGTFGTASAKRAIQVAGKGYRSKEYPNGLDIDTTKYLSSMIPVERGFVWGLKETYYGNPSKDRHPVNVFVNEVNKYPGLFDIAIGIEGLILSRSSHASGIILNDEDPYDNGMCYMKTPKGEIITQFDLHQSEAMGVTKYDFLVTAVMDKITTCIELLQKNGYLPQKKLREIYNEYLDPMILDYEDNEIWKKICDGHILDLFQFDSAVGGQGIQDVQPQSLDELSYLNGLIRLMAEQGKERPLDKFVRYKNDLSLWYQEMNEEGLTEEEQKSLEPYMKPSYGICISQEDIMWGLMDEKITGFSLLEANRARKVISKKKMDKLAELKKQIEEKATSPAIGRYVWEYIVGPSRGYGFSILHAKEYAMVAYQTAMLATKYPSIYWNTACLIVNAESIEQKENVEKEKGSDYAKIATAIGKIKSSGIEVSLVNINDSDFTFTPDEKNNRILYGLKPLSYINNEIIQKIKEKAPYTGIKDFMNKVKIKKPAMISLIKGGAFDEVEKNLDNRKEILAYYLYNSSEDIKKSLNLQNFPTLIKRRLVPKEFELEVRIYNFNKFIRKNRRIEAFYWIDENCLEFFERFLPELIDETEKENNRIVIKQEVWDSFYQKSMDQIRNWLKEKQEQILKSLNKSVFYDLWQKYGLGTISSWEMDSLCFYYHPHELLNVDYNDYGLSNFDNLPEDPLIERYWRNIPLFRLTRIIGTVIAKNDNRHSISLLTPESSVVNVMFSKEHYAIYKKQISQVGNDGVKHTVEKGWFTRGTKLLLTGMRRGDTFVIKKYSNTPSETIYKITEINDATGKIKITHERAEV